jgi:hypothetical protein
MPTYARPVNESGSGWSDEDKSSSPSIFFLRSSQILLPDSSLAAGGILGSSEYQVHPSTCACMLYVAYIAIPLLAVKESRFDPCRDLEAL